MSISRRSFLKVGGAAGAATAFSAFPISQIAAQGSDVTLTWWTSHGGALGELFVDLAQEFSDLDNGITVQVEYQGEYRDTMAKVIAGAAGNALPDVLHIGDAQAVPLAENELLMPLDDLINGPNGINLEEYTNPVYRGVIDGTFYQLAYGVSTPIFYFNVEALEAAGLEGAPDTWDDFFNVYLPALSSDDAFGFSYLPGAWWQQAGAYWCNDVMVNDDNFETDLANPAAVAWFEQMQSARQTDQIKFPLPTDEGGAVGVFASGNSPMLIHSTGLLGSIDELVGDAFTVDAGFLPAGPAGRFIPNGGNGLSIMSGLSDEKRDAAWEFIRFLQAPDQFRRYDEVSGYIPLTQSTAEAMQDVFENDPRRQVAADQLEFSRWHMRVHRLAAGERALAEAWDECVQTDVNVQERLESLQDEAIDIIEEAGFEPTLPTT